MASIVLVSCVKRKHPYRAQAKDLYDSTLFRAQRAYAEHFGDQWFVLSAKYGLLDPEVEIGPYEETLKTASGQQKRLWSERVFADLQKHTRPTDTVIITAGEDYCRYLVPLLAGRGYEVRRPIKGVTMGFIPGRLRQLIESDNGSKATYTGKKGSEAQSDHRPHIKKKLHIDSLSKVSELERFYSLLGSLKQIVGGPYRLKDLKPDLVPTRGLYFFFEDGELRPDGKSNRVVRVGTHGLKAGSKSTLYTRLTQHRGTSSGGGNHRGSIFRLHVGTALINAGSFVCSTWSKGSSASPETVVSERELEKAVSEYIGRMQVLLLNLPDGAGPNSLRGFIERNAIGLLAGREPAAENWLGFSTQNPAIMESYLWNVNHIHHAQEPDFLTCLERLISEQDSAVRK